MQDKIGNVKLRPWVLALKVPAQPSVVVVEASSKPKGHKPDKQDYCRERCTLHGEYSGVHPNCELTISGVSYKTLNIEENFFELRCQSDFGVLSEVDTAALVKQAE